jgi:hypothetical protein
MRFISDSGGKFNGRGGSGFGCCGYVAGEACGGSVLVIDVEDGESVAAADIVGVVVVALAAKVVVIVAGPATGSCGGMAVGDGGGGLGAAWPKA